MPAYYMRVALRSVNNVTRALIVNTLHYEVDTLTSPPDMQSICADLDAHWVTQYLSILTVNDTLLDLTTTVETYPGATPAQGIRTKNLPGTRTAPDTGLSPGICMLVQTKTDTPKRYGRGRLFMPPAYAVGSNVLAGGSWSSSGSYYIAVNQWAGRALVPFTAGSTGYTPIVFSRTRVSENQTPYQFPIVAYLLKPEQHFLRSRTTSP